MSPAEEGLLAEHGLAWIIARLRHRTRAERLSVRQKYCLRFTIYTPLQATVLLACLNFVLLLLLLHEARRPSSGERMRLSLASGLLSLVSAFRERGLRKVSWVFLLQELGWGAYFYFIPVLLFHNFNSSSTRTSLFMSVMGVGFCISFAFAMPFLSKRYSASPITSWSLLVTSVLLAASTFAPSMILQWLLILPISVVVAVSYGALIILFTDLATEDSKGEEGLWGGGGGLGGGGRGAGVAGEARE